MSETFRFNKEPQRGREARNPVIALFEQRGKLLTNGLKGSCLALLIPGFGESPSDWEAWLACHTEAGQPAAVYRAVDHHEWTDIASREAEVATVVDLLINESRARSVHISGYSFGALFAARLTPPAGVTVIRRDLINPPIGPWAPKKAKEIALAVRVTRMRPRAAKLLAGRYVRGYNERGTDGYRDWTRELVVLRARMVTEVTQAAAEHAWIRDNGDPLVVAASRTDEFFEQPAHFQRAGDLVVARRGDTRLVELLGGHKHPRGERGQLACRPPMTT